MNEKNRNFGYIRVSTISQNIDRQLEEMLKLGIKKRNIYIDYQSGKDFERQNYQVLKRKLKKNDLLIVKSIDRLGRNYEMIIQEWSDITKRIQADIFVIDFPLLDTRVDKQNLVGRFISDIVLQVLSFVAQNERENIRARQAEGIRIAKENQITRAAAAMRYAAQNDFEGIVVSGNAPTAVFEAMDLYQKGEMNLKAIVGVPVGFVGAADSKEALHNSDIPNIIVEGPKGGTPIAVACVNSLIQHL